MKHFLLFLLYTAASLQAADHPHIILVMADDQGYGDCGYTGHPYLKTPNLDAMAKHSVIFDRFYAGTPVCSPTRASVMTGRNPVRVNVPNHGHYLRPKETTIAEALKSKGYLTAHFGKWHIGSVQKESPTSPGGQGFDHWLTGLNFFDRNPYLSLNGKFDQFKGQGTVISMDHALAHLKSHAAKHPTFTVIWFPSPHDPHRETSSKPSLYKDKPHAPYYQEITLIDEQMGRLRQTLRDLKIADQTLLWYTSDNGGLVKEHSGGREKKGSVYEGGLCVSSLIEYPSKFKPTRIAAPTSSTDIYPTLLALTETTVEKQGPPAKSKFLAVLSLEGRECFDPVRTLVCRGDGPKLTATDSFKNATIRFPKNVSSLAYVSGDVFRPTEVLTTQFLPQAPPEGQSIIKEVLPYLQLALGAFEGAIVV